LGARHPDLSILLVLSLLTAGLLVVAFVVLRRAAHLSQLREDFVANVSHDLRTPLSQIRMFSETLLLGRMGDQEERERALSIIRQQAINLTDLVDNILSAAGHGGAEVEPVRVNLADLLREVEDTLGPQAADQSIDIRSDVRGGPMAMVDPAVLRRVLVNLLDNAIKYGPAGQPETVTLLNDGANLDVVVEDSGDGIPPPRSKARMGAIHETRR
jgi:two-component system phosphate regulon sensor histidine kinase PhoR